MSSTTWTPECLFKGTIFCCSTSTIRLLICLLMEFMGKVCWRVIFLYWPFMAFPCSSAFQNFDTLRSIYCKLSGELEVYTFAKEVIGNSYSRWRSIRWNPSSNQVFALSSSHSVWVCKAEDGDSTVGGGSSVAVLLSQVFLVERIDAESFASQEKMRHMNAVCFLRLA